MTNKRTGEESPKGRARLRCLSRLLRRSSRVSSFAPINKQMASEARPVTSPVPDAWYPLLAFLLVSLGLAVTASFFIYEATTSRKNRVLFKELGIGAAASVLLGFGSLFLLLSAGVYV